MLAAFCKGDVERVVLLRACILFSGFFVGI